MPKPTNHLTASDCIDVRPVPRSSLKSLVNLYLIHTIFLFTQVHCLLEAIFHPLCLSFPQTDAHTSQSFILISLLRILLEPRLENWKCNRSGPRLCTHFVFPCGRFHPQHAFPIPIALLNTLPTVTRPLHEDQFRSQLLSVAFASTVTSVLPSFWIARRRLTLHSQTSHRFSR